jgi:hypothetical protein
VCVCVCVCVCDISNLRVNDLILSLLTWRKWWAPDNASKEQMGFNSGFKGLSFQLVNGIIVEIFFISNVAYVGQYM